MFKKKDPLFEFEIHGHKLADFKLVKIDKADKQKRVKLPFPVAGVAQALESFAGESVVCEQDIPHFTVQNSLKPIPGVKNVIAVGSGKGGVGKSTVALSLALALKSQGASVGVLDADIYGPSQPSLLGGAEQPKTKDKKSMEPVMKLGLQTMSIGYLLEGDTQPVVWRGPMVSTALKQLTNDTQWKDLDYLIIDLPPGTGDIQLTLVQKIPLAGAIIVTTPQDLSLIDAQKALRMFEKVKVPVLGVVENMSVHVCDNCGHESKLFGEGAGDKLQEQFSVPLLGRVPLSLEVREQIVAGQVGAVFQEMALKAAMNLALRPKSYSHKFNVRVDSASSAE